MIASPMARQPQAVGSRDLIIGIDPGVSTGFAIWRRDTKQFSVVTSMKLHEAMNIVQGRWVDGRLHSVSFEDARQRKGGFGLADLKAGKFGAGVREGVGSVKRDCGIWHDFLSDLGIPFDAVAPKDAVTKMEALRFARLTGWQQRTNEHGRDAAMLVWGR